MSKMAYHLQTFTKCSTHRLLLIELRNPVLDGTDEGMLWVVHTRWGRTGAGIVKFQALDLELDVS